MLDWKGIWIPRQIATDEKLSHAERTLYSFLLFLSNENNTCYCTNTTVQEILTISLPQSKRIIKSLKDKAYIDLDYNNQNDDISKSTRVITVLKHLECKGIKNDTKQSIKSDTDDGIKSEPYINKYKNNNKNRLSFHECNFNQRQYTKEFLETLYENNF